MKEFRMPRKLLTWHSSFFAAALDPEGNWASSGDDTFQIQDSIEVLEIFSCWIYTRKLRDPPGRAITEDQGKERDPGDNYLDDLKLSKVWVFGDMRGIPALMNAAVDMLHERFTTTWSQLEAAPISYVYDNTKEESKLRIFVVESWARTESIDSFLQADVSGIDGAFVMAVFEGLVHLHTIGTWLGGCKSKESAAKPRSIFETQSLQMARPLRSGRKAAPRRPWSDGLTARGRGWSVDIIILAQWSECLDTYTGVGHNLAVVERRLSELENKHSGLYCAQNRLCRSWTVDQDKCIIPE
jgi:hypothetical protein